MQLGLALKFKSLSFYSTGYALYLEVRNNLRSNLCVSATSGQSFPAVIKLTISSSVLHQISPVTPPFYAQEKNLLVSVPPSSDLSKTSRALFIHSSNERSIFFEEKL